MPKSYRCPAPILELGERCLRRMKRGYFDRKVAPADHAGSVNEVNEAEIPISVANPGDDWLFIARTNYEAKRLHAALHAAGKPARWVKSPDGPTARSEGLRALFALERDEPVTGTQWAKAIELIPVSDKDKRPMLSRGVKTRWSKEHVDEWDTIFASDLRSVGAEQPLVDAIRSGAWCSLVDRGEQWRKQAVRWGADLASTPKIRVGTVHSVKGAEADNVVFLTTISRRVEQGMTNQDQADEEHRIAYVAVTRARRNLYIVNEGRYGKTVPRMEVL